MDAEVRRFMSLWVLVIVVAVVALALVLGVWYVGRSLPVGHTATVTACIARPRQAVWDMLVQVERFPDWRPDVQSAERIPNVGDREVWRETNRFGKVEGHVAHKSPLQRLVIEIVTTERSYGGRWTYDLADCPGGTQLTITEEGQVYNPFFRFMSRYLFGYHHTMTDYLRAMGRHFGLDVTPERVR
jgi:uncharacterized protein YndB with AHSA1/START domain